MLQYNLLHPDGPAAPVTQQEYEAGKAWVTEFSNVFYQKNMGALGDYLTDDVSITFANQTQVQGFDKVADVVDSQAAALNSYETSIEWIVVLENGIIYQSLVTYNFSNGETRTVRCIATVAKKTTESKATGYHIYGDMTEASKVFLQLAGAPPHIA